MAIGLLAATMACSLSLEKGFREGFARGVQSLETGQVQVRSSTGQIINYFMARALAENLGRVVASSSRLEFTAVLSLPSGASKQVLVRACNFAQETKVTDLAARITPRGPALISGLVLSRSLAMDPEWSGATTITASDPEGKFHPDEIPVAGVVNASAGAFLDHIVFMDLGTALRLVGAGSPVTSIALKLRPGLDPDLWIDDNQKAFQNYALTLEPWSAVFDQETRSEASAIRGLTLVLYLVTFLAGLFMVAIGAWSRHPRSGLALVLRGGRSEWIRTLGLLVGGFLAATGLLVGLVSLAHPWFLGDLEATFPFVGPARALWSGDPGLLAIPGAAVAATLAVVVPFRT